MCVVVYSSSSSSSKWRESVAHSLLFLRSGFLLLALFRLVARRPEILQAEKLLRAEV
jgi:hypothetical protein